MAGVGGRSTASGDVTVDIQVCAGHEVTDFMLDRHYMPGSQCLSFAMPLIVDVLLLDWIARVLLWPLAAWHLGGGWLWRRFQARRPLRRGTPERT